MLNRLFLIAVFVIAQICTAEAQKKEISQARDNVKAGKQLVEAEKSMRKLLSDSTCRSNEKIWLVLFDAVKKQYESVNEKMYLKQAADTSSLFAATYRMFGILESLDSVDAAPDSKGRVSIKYRKRHAEYLNALRTNLYNGALFQMNKKNYNVAFDYFAAYIDCANQPLFCAFDHKSTDKLLTSAAFYSVYCGYKSNNPEHTLRYADIAQTDTSRLDFVYQYMAETYKVQKDTVKSLDVLEAGFARYPRSEYYFSHIFDYYFKCGNVEKANAFCDSAINADSLNVIALLAKSTVLFSQKRYDECIALCNKIISIDKKCPDAYLNAGLSYFNQAIEADRTGKPIRDKRTQTTGLYRKAMPYLQTYRSLNPNGKDLWAMPLYTIYLNLNMGKEFDEIDTLLKR